MIFPGKIGVPSLRFFKHKAIWKGGSWNLDAWNSTGSTIVSAHQVQQGQGYREGQQAQGAWAPDAWFFRLVQESRFFMSGMWSSILNFGYFAIDPYLTGCEFSIHANWHRWLQKNDDNLIRDGAPNFSTEQRCMQVSHTQMRQSFAHKRNHLSCWLNFLFLVKTSVFVDPASNFLIQFPFTLGFNFFKSTKLRCFELPTFLVLSIPKS